ncbi:MAG: DUF933 domain-containing protein [bacterium]
MKLGIIGKPQCGKTTIFSAAAGQDVAVGDYSQASHRAVIKVPDERVDNLSEIYQPQKTVYAEIEYLDAPGFTGKGKEAGTVEITPEIREMDALIMVIDAFSADSDPERFIGNLFDEMILSDQVIIERNLDSKIRKMKLTGDAALKTEVTLLQRLLACLESEKPLIELELDDSETKLLRGYQFVTLKPVLIVLNIAEKDLPGADEIETRYAHLKKPGKCELVAVCGKVQAELATLDPDEQQAFFDELGVKEPALNKLIRTSYALLGLISFLTVGKDEVRAWTIKKGTPAVKAASAVHSDIERGFIRAEVTAYDDVMTYKTPAALKAAGKIRLEGKDYIVRDGDEILFRFNV